LTKQDLDALIKAARSDKVFLRKCIFSFKEALGEKRFELTEDEMKSAQRELERIYKGVLPEISPSNTVPTPNTLAEQQTGDAVIRITLDLLQNSIEDARKAFRNLRLLSNATFTIGLSLFVLSAVSGLVLQKETFSLVFGGLGTIAIVAIFITKPKDEIQAALSNLLQAETIFLNFYDQLHFWAPYASNGSIDERRQASHALNEATSFALQAFQLYVEPHQKTEKSPKRTQP